jgi:hypothetical protein
MKVLLTAVFRVNISLLTKLQSVVFLWLAIALKKIKAKKRGQSLFLKIGH